MSEHEPQQPAPPPPASGGSVSAVESWVSAQRMLSDDLQTLIDSVIESDPENPARWVRPRVRRCCGFPICAKARPKCAGRERARRPRLCGAISLLELCARARSENWADVLILICLQPFAEFRGHDVCAFFAITTRGLHGVALVPSPCPPRAPHIYVYGSKFTTGLGGSVGGWRSDASVDRR